MNKVRPLLRVALLMMIASLSFPLTARALEAGYLAGAYRCVHRDWRDMLYISSDGTYRRGNGDPGRWTWDGQKLVLHWAHWGPETLYPDGDGTFRARGYQFEIHRTTMPIPGRYFGVHRDWRGPVIFQPNGRYHRANGDPGSWKYDGRTLVIKWDHWGTDTLDSTGPGVFRARKDPLTLTWTGPLDQDREPAPQIDPALAGTYQAVHKDWRDTVTLHRDGRYERGNGDPGHWTWDGQKLVLHWDHWGPETLYPQGPGIFAARGYKFEMHRIGDRVGEPEHVYRRDPVPPPQYQVQPVAPMPPPAPTAMSQQDFQGIIDAINNAAFSQDKLGTLRTAAGGQHFSAAQVGTLLDAFSFSSDKMAALKIVHNEIVDPQNNYTILGHFTFSSDKEQAQHILSP